MNFVLCSLRSVFSFGDALWKSSYFQWQRMFSSSFSHLCCSLEFHWMRSLFCVFLRFSSSCSIFILQCSPHSLFTTTARSARVNSAAWAARLLPCALASALVLPRPTVCRALPAPSPPCAAMPAPELFARPVSNPALPVCHSVVALLLLLLLD